MGTHVRCNQRLGRVTLSGAEEVCIMLGCVLQRSNVMLAGSGFNAGEEGQSMDTSAMIELLVRIKLVHHGADDGGSGKESARERTVDPVSA